MYGFLNDTLAAESRLISLCLAHFCMLQLFAYFIRFINTIVLAYP